MPPGVIPTRMDFQQSAKPPHRPDSAVSPDKGVPHSDWLAKYTAVDSIGQSNTKYSTLVTRGFCDDSNGQAKFDRCTERRSLAPVARRWERFIVLGITGTSLL